MSSKLPPQDQMTVYVDDVVLRSDENDGGRTLRLDALSLEEVNLLCLSDEDYQSRIHTLNELSLNRMMKDQALLRKILRDRYSGIHVDQPTPKRWPANSKKDKKPSRLSHLLRPAGPRTVEKAMYLLDIASALVPKRISNEEIGDALETIDRMQKAGRPKWLVYLKVVTTFWWVFLHTLLHYAERLVGILKLAAGESDHK